MPHINELLSAAVTVIVRYHEVKLAIVPSTEAEKRSSLLEKPHDTMIADLKALITEATTADPTREPLLTYVLYNINILRKFQDRIAPMEEAELETLKQQWIKFVLDMKTLLETSQSTMENIRYDDKNINPYGLMKGILQGYAYCKSGKILSETLFPTLGLTVATPRETITEALTRVFISFQFHLREVALAVREEDVTKREMRMEVRRSELDARGSGLDARESILAMREDELIRHDVVAEPKPRSIIDALLRAPVGTGFFYSSRPPIATLLGGYPPRMALPHGDEAHAPSLGSLRVGSS